MSKRRSMADAPHPFRIRDFRFYWTARFASTVAQMSMIVVIGWQVYDIARQTMSLEKAALQLGFIGLVQFVPLFALTLFTGWVADRVDRRIIARASIALELLCAAALAWLTYTGSVTLLWLFAVAALLGVARAFAGPALRRARSESGAARVPAPGDRPELDRLADRRDRRPGGGRLSLRLGPAHALHGQRRPVRALALLHDHDPADRPKRDRGLDQPLAADDRRPPLCATATGWCSAPSRSICSRCCSAGRRRCCPSSPATSCTPTPPLLAICAPRRRSERP